MPDSPSSNAPSPFDRDRSLDRDGANAIRALAMDAVQQANSGHPGMPMGMADIALALWQGYMRHNPADPHWVNRDRFLLSNGHGSMLQYALLHLTGYDLSIEEIKRFRQLKSKTPGHPEFHVTPGVETTTGPLGQGFANGVGMALAEKLMAATFNRPDYPIVDHHTYVFMGDGCMMEGISHEAASLAGYFGLGKLICFYDDNGISIDGEVKGWFADDTAMRFQAYNWHVVPNVDGDDVAALEDAIRWGIAETGRPTLICCKTIIGKGAPHRQGTAKAHGEALGKEEVAEARKVLGWEYPPFEIPPKVYAFWNARERGSKLQRDWDQMFSAYAKAFPDEAKEFKRRSENELPATWNAVIEGCIAKLDEKAETLATRKASQAVIEMIAPSLPEFLGGSADLTGSVFTNWSGSKAVTAHEAGNFVHYGVREFGMITVMSGMVAHGGLIPYGGTFLTFSDYCRNGLRMAALMGIRNIAVFTHDSIGLGEDGPTHQPIEHAATLRLIPNMEVWRPCDTVETAVAWRAAIEHTKGPTCLLLTRQNLAFQKRDAQQRAAIARGGYVLADAAGGKADVVIIGTGSEVDLAMKAREQLAADDIKVRVVSMPCTSAFDRQDPGYRASVLPSGIPRVAVEAGVTDYWRKYVGLEGAVVGIDRFGESAPAKDLFKFFEMTSEHVASAARALVGKSAQP